jgi:16S rRNA (guanine966-N2)-methyltransferase
MTKVIAGKFKGRNLRVPISVTRPTTSRVREAIFSAITHKLGDLSDLRVLDLYAGSGALGIEALSRGAAEAVFVELDRKACQVIESNIEDLGLNRVQIQNKSVISELEHRSTTGAFDLVLVDAPYTVSDEVIDGHLINLVENDWLKEDSLVVVERTKRCALTWPKAFTESERREYGDTTIWYGHYKRNSD